uniref:Uncharacterized protein n=1 Tax=Triticum urartu TaxID=4572 RepID=A0A8R7QSM9_TRIUA
MKWSQGHIDPCFLLLIVHPQLQFYLGVQRQVLEGATRVFIEASRVRWQGENAVDVDADVVVVDVLHVRVLEGVNLDNKEVGTVLLLQDTKVLRWQCVREVPAWGDEEGQAIGTHARECADDAENDGGRE